MHLEHLFDRKRAVYNRQIHKRYIHLADFKQLNRIRRGAVGDLKLYIRILRMELFKIRQKEILAQRIACAYHKPAGLQRAHTVQLVLSSGDKADSLIRIAVQHSAFAGQRYASARARKKRAAERILQPVHGLAYGRLTHIKLPCRVGQAAAARNGAEYAV